VHGARLAALRDDVAGAEAAVRDDFVVRGTASALEKSYFRLTGAPDPASVRPEPVLAAALARLLGLLAAGSESYFYALDQFKGMRQDCTVQHLRSGLTVAVYEAHARAALAYGDVPEYNQCQTQLAGLHAAGLPGCTGEFLAYRLLYQTAHARQGERVALLQTLRAAAGPARARAACPRRRVTACACPRARAPAPGPARPGALRCAAARVSQVSYRRSRARGQAQAAEHPAVRHALQVREAVAAGDFAAYFKLYADAPNLGRALMDMALPRVRYSALHVLTRAYQPSVPLAFVARMLGFVARGPRAAGSPAAAPLPGCSQAVFAGAAAPQVPAPALAAAGKQRPVAR